MKKIMKPFVLVAAAAMALASCQKNEMPAPEKQEVHFTIKAGIETKTYITDNGNGTYSPSWTVGDNLGVMFTLGNEKKKDTQFTATSVTGGVATFEGRYTFDINENGLVDGNFYAFYPSEAFNKSYSDGEIRLDLKEVQKPTSTSFDRECDLLIAKPCYYLAEATGKEVSVEIDDMYFARKMSVLRINLKSDFLSNEVVKSVSFDAANMNLTGAMRFNLSEGKFVRNEATSGKSTVTAEYSDDPIAVAGEKNSAYLVIAPVTIPEGTTLTFTIETENYDIEKVVTAKSDMVMPAGNVAVINLTIEEENCTAKTEDTSDYYGTYAILAKRTTGGYWYMTNDLGTASTKRFTAEEAGEALPEEGVTLGASKLWQVSKSGEYYTVKSVGADKYITWSSGNSADLGDEGIGFTIEKKEDGTYNLSYAASDSKRYLSLNDDSRYNYFALYKSGQKADLSLIPAVLGEEPAILTVSPPSQMPAEAGNGSFTYELKNPKDGVQLNATKEAAWITNVTVGDRVVTYTVTANESKEVREAVITLTYGDLTEDVTITQAGKQAEGGEPAEVATWSWAGGVSADFKNFNGVISTTGFGADYADDHAAYRIKLDTNNDNFVVKVNGAIQSVSVGVKMIGGANTSYLDFQGSSDGSSYSSVQKHTISGKQNDILELTTSNTFDASYRYIKFNFTKGSNVGVGPITITYIPDNSEGGGSGETPAAPVLNITEEPTSDIAAEGDVVTVKYSVTNPVEGKSVTASANQTWVNNFDCSVAGEVSFIVDENTGAARNATVTLEYEGATSQTVTINQAAAEQGGGTIDPVTIDVIFSNYTEGTQYAKNETHKINDDLTIYVNDGHFTKELRLYDSSSNNTTAWSSELPGYISGMTFNAGYKAATLKVYGSSDGTTWTEVGTVTTKSSYNDYVVNFTLNAYKYFKLDAVGAQIRITRLGVTYQPVN